ncbi:hypothetical protein HDK64DRAFT_251874 [Phyllosticta capitalensis]
MTTGMAAPISIFSQPATTQGLFGKLPAELQLQIFESLDYGSVIFMATTNHYWIRRLNPLDFVSNKDKVAFLRRATTFQQNISQYPPRTVPCDGCFHFGPPPFSYEPRKMQPNILRCFDCRHPVSFYRKVKNTNWHGIGCLKKVSVSILAQSATSRHDPHGTLGSAPNQALTALDKCKCKDSRTGWMYKFISPIEE